jgi:hypothetical protein
LRAAYDALAGVVQAAQQHALATGHSNFQEYTK